MDSLRQLHKVDPETFSTPMLAERFRISPEAVRRILKGRWEPTRDERVRMAERERVAREKRREESRAEERMRHESLQKEYAWKAQRRDGFTLK
uniref:Required for respiratory growth protein 9, mitochondrial n=1 Tax=Ganoderma boninense TaxID=34458 RepID=A0A5K1JT94_9APHY|nr:Cytochrome P450 monooxygenase CYP52X1 [Ganoderma boninense]